MFSLAFLKRLGSHSHKQPQHKTPEFPIANAVPGAGEITDVAELHGGKGNRCLPIWERSKWKVQEKSTVESSLQKKNLDFVGSYAR